MRIIQFRLCDGQKATNAMSSIEIILQQTVLIGILVFTSNCPLKADPVLGSIVISHSIPQFSNIWSTCEIQNDANPFVSEGFDYFIDEYYNPEFKIGIDYTTKIVALVGGRELKKDVRPKNSMTPVTVQYDILSKGPSRAIPSNITGYISWKVTGFYGMTVTVNGSTASSGSITPVNHSGSFHITFEPGPGPGPGSGPAKTLSATSITSTSAYLEGRIDAAGYSGWDIRFHYWEKGAVDKQTSEWMWVLPRRIFSQSIKGLEPNTIYEYKLEAKQSDTRSVGATESLAQ